MKEGYKRSEKGIIPEEWIVKKFDECISITNGQVDPKIEPYCDMPHIGPGNVEKFTGKLLYVNTAKEDMQTSGKYLFDEDDILYGKINPQLGKVVAPKFKGICSADMYPLKCNKKFIIPLFLNYTLLYKDFFKYSVSVSMRTGMPKINRDELNEYKILLPSLKEQEKIADILSTVDSQIEDTDKLIEKTKELKKGLMQRLLTKGIGHTEFKKTEVGEIPMEWEVRNLIDVSEIIMGQSPNSDSYNDLSNGIPFFQGKTEFGSIYPSIKKWCTEPTKISEPLDILISVRAPVGEVNINKYTACIGRGLAAIRATESNYRYIYYYLQNVKEKLNLSAQGSTFTAINSSDLKNIKIALPTLIEQEKIADTLSVVDNQIEEYKNKKVKLEELKRGLMQQLLTGKIRVK